MPLELRQSVLPLVTALQSRVEQLKSAKGRERVAERVQNRRRELGVAASASVTASCARPHTSRCLLGGRVESERGLRASGRALASARDGTRGGRRSMLTAGRAEEIKSTCAARGGSRNRSSLRAGRKRDPVGTWTTVHCTRADSTTGARTRRSASVSEDHLIGSPRTDLEPVPPNEDGQSD